MTGILARNTNAFIDYTHITLRVILAPPGVTIRRYSFCESLTAVHVKRRHKAEAIKLSTLALVQRQHFREKVAALGRIAPAINQRFDFGICIKLVSSNLMKIFHLR